MWKKKKKEGTWGSGKNISWASIHPFSTSSSSPSLGVGKITTQPGLRGRGEPGWSVRKQMSPLAAASASGESCTGGALPRTFTSHFSGIPLTTASSRRGWFFRLSVSRVQLFYLGAVLTRPRLADAKTQPLHDSVIRDRGRDLAGAHSTFRDAASATSAVRDWRLLSRLHFLWPKRAFVPRKLEPWDPKGNEFPALSNSAGGGKRVDWRRVRANTLTWVTFWATISFGCQQASR